MLVSGGKILAIDSVNHDNTLIGDGVNAPLGVNAADTYVTVQPLTEDPASINKNYVLHWDGLTPAGSAVWHWQEEQAIGPVGDNVSARNGLRAVTEFDCKYIEMTDQSKAAVDLVSSNSAIWEKQQIIVTNEVEPTAIPLDVVGMRVEEPTQYCADPYTCATRDWVSANFVGEANKDGEIYGRQDGAWVKITEGDDIGVITYDESTYNEVADILAHHKVVIIQGKIKEDDHTINFKLPCVSFNVDGSYIELNTAWPTGSVIFKIEKAEKLSKSLDDNWSYREINYNYVEEAPDDDKVYGRKNYEWVEVHDSDYVPPLYAVVRVTTEAELRQAVFDSLDIYVWEESDSSSLKTAKLLPAVVNCTNDAVHVTVMVPNTNLNEPEDDTVTADCVTWVVTGNDWSDANTVKLVPDAPADGKSYLRKNNSWIVVNDAEHSWAHWGNDSGWENFSSKKTLSNAGFRLNEGSLTDSQTPSVPAGLYSFDLEFSFNTKYGQVSDDYIKTDIEIVYGQRPLRAMSMLFDNSIPSSEGLFQCHRIGGIFRMPATGDINFTVENMTNNKVGQCKVSHLFVYRLGD